MQFGSNRVVKTGFGIWAVLCLALAGCGTRAPNPVAHLPTRASNECMVMEVIDGDTVRARCNGQNWSLVRLMHFDAPESQNPRCRAEKRAAKRAKQDLERILSQATVIAPKVHGYDRYDRTLAEFTVDGVPLHWLMINAGNAVHYAGGARIDWCKSLKQ